MYLATPGIWCYHDGMRETTAGNQALITQMRKGAVEYCILALLAGRERYGYELVQALSGVDGMLVTEGTVYPILSRLKRDGLVSTEWRESREGPPRKYYRLTPAGAGALDSFKTQWRVFAAAVETFLEKGQELCDDHQHGSLHNDRPGGSPSGTGRHSE